MKKIAKMSLVAAVAVAGLTNANAGALEDAIKNVDVFGYANLRYNSYEVKDGANTQTVYHKVVLGVTSKITDDISYTYAGAVTNGTDTADAGVSYMVNTSNDADGTGTDSTSFYSVYSHFTYTGIPGVTAVLGQQGIPTPFTVVYDTYGNTHEGTGLVLAGKVGAVNLVGAYYMNTNLSNGGAKLNGAAVSGLLPNMDSENLSALMATVKLSGVSIDATYVNLDNIGNGLSLGLGASLDLDAVKLTPYARYSTMDLGDAGVNEDQALWFIGTGFKAGIVGGKLAYGQTDKDGGFVAFDNDAKAAFLGWNLSMNGIADAEMLQAQLNVNVTDKINVALQHDTLEDATTADDKETFMTVSYKPAKNFTAYVRGGVDEINDVKNNRGRIQLTYTF
jgi:hypothetical protein